ncbi:pseudouridine synthase [Synechococcus sp. PCC 7336]|uniref:pseudouridine synthase n=1 Tax=Synechococcus sp. PCC 7336 TaxID=195250 RepID=UPI00034BB677|nr:pseudouridine synthase [Synechococcus sp. PCC 7336]
MVEPQRLQKIMARWGVASRRQAEAMIVAGRVRLNGKVVAELGTKADPQRDRIELDGKPLARASSNFSIAPPQLRYILLHKPAGAISTCSDPKGRQTVLDLLPEAWRSQTRFFPVGRLDAASTGALLLTNDGDFTLKLTHPRYHLPKTYRVEVEGHPSETVLQQWREGVALEDGRTLPARVHKERIKPHRHCTILTVVLQEGRNRQIRRVAAQLGFPVRSLHRQAIGSLQLGQLKPGQFRLLQKAEIHMIKYEQLRT